MAHEKSYWSLVDWAWKNGSWKYRTKEEVPGQLTLNTGPHGAPQPIERLEVTQSKEFLGVMIRPDRKMTDQKKHMLQKARKWADSIRCKKVSREDAWYCLNHTASIIPS